MQVSETNTADDAEHPMDLFRHKTVVVSKKGMFAKGPDFKFVDAVPYLSTQPNVPQVYAGCSQTAHGYGGELSNPSAVTEAIVIERDDTLETSSVDLTELEDEDKTAKGTVLRMSNDVLDSSSESTAKVSVTRKPMITRAHLERHLRSKRQNAVDNLSGNDKMMREVVRRIRAATNSVRERSAKNFDRMLEFEVRDRMPLGAEQEAWFKLQLDYVSWVQLQTSLVTYELTAGMVKFRGE